MAKKKQTLEHEARGVVLNLAGQKAEVYIYDDIGFYGTNAQEFAKQMNNLPKNKEVVVHINSPGGSIFEGIAIYNILRRHGNVTTVCEGIAASIAAIIFLAGDKRLIVDNSMVMVHPAMFTVQNGDKKEFKEAQQLLERAEQNIRSIYESRLNVETELLDEWLNNDIWMSSEEALEYGLATEIIDAEMVVNYLSGKSLVGKTVKQPKAFTERIREAILSVKDELFSIGEPNMNFETWLKAQLSSLGLTMEDVTDDLRAKLKAKYDAGIKDGKIPTPSNSTNTTDGTYRTEDGVVVAKLADIEKVATDRIAAAEARMNDLQNVAEKHNTVELNEDSLKAIGVKGKTIRALHTHAIRNNWTADQFELEVLRAQKPSVGHVGIQVASTEREVLDNNEAVAVALLRNAGVPASRTHKETGEQWGVNHWYKDEVLERADAPILRNISLHMLLDQAHVAAKGFRYNGNYKSDAFINAVQDSLFSLRNTGGTTWSGLQIFDDVAHKFLWAAYEAIGTTWQECFKVENLNDFKPHNRYRLNMEGGYEIVGADGELKHGGMSDQKYTVQADTYGKIVGLTRRDIINDDLGALNQVMSALGMEGARFVEELAWVTFLDQVPTLFPTDNSLGNYVDGADSVLGVDGLTLAETAFSNQTHDGAPIGLLADRIVVGTQDKVVAGELFSERSLRGTQASSPAKRRPDNNPHVGAYRPVVTGYLNNTNIKQRVRRAPLATTNVGQAVPNQSSTHWLMLPAPNSPMGASFMVGFLNGNQRPIINQGDPNFDVLGLRWRAYHDCGTGNGDPKMGVYSKGAA